jgi:hypothetical protein
MNVADRMHAARAGRWLASGEKRGGTVGAIQGPMIVVVADALHEEPHPLSNVLLCCPSPPKAPLPSLAGWVAAVCVRLLAHCVV